MKYRVTLNNKVYEIEVERGNAILKAEYEMQGSKKVRINSTPVENVQEELKKKEEVIEENNVQEIAEDAKPSVEE